MFKLVIQDDEGKTTVVPLIRDEITIGRKEGNTIRLTERNVSRRHARILRNNGEVQIEDLGSYNGIRVNNARIAERVSLRLSDQVQIGDYKLYLKAEGVEQVDEARTMPIERIDSSTEVMAVAQTPTSPMVAVGTQPPSPAAAASARAGVGVADTDPAGRPVATPAQVAALTQSAAYGKLVVVSSNFAGKEFDLTRPQMIIGRTDENDLVINHRSISRNHAKVVRDTETGRYTISDLQSSNGVRVNGQDYGKVELRRSDVVDLGHVRLRFVEPGEDFIFARDAVIADVPEAGGKRGLMIAVVLAILVLGVVAVVFLMHSGSTNTEANGKGGDNSTLNHKNGSDLAVNTVPIDAAVAQPAVAIDAAAVAVNPQPNGADVKVECLQNKDDKDWQALTNCAAKLEPLDPTTATELKAKAKAEQANQLAVDRVKAALNDGSLPKAARELSKIDDDSVYKAEVKAAYEAALQKTQDDFKGRAQAANRAKRCADVEKLISQAAAQGQAVVDVVRPFKCAVEVAVTPPVDHSQDHKNPNPPPGPGSAAVAVTPPAACDAQALADKARQELGINAHAQALADFEKSLKCKADSTIYPSAYMAACGSSNMARAKHYFNLLPASRQTSLVQICLRNGIDPRQ